MANSKLSRGSFFIFRSHGPIFFVQSITDGPRRRRRRRRRWASTWKVVSNDGPVKKSPN